jgi:hypothetical protein
MKTNFLRCFALLLIAFAAFSCSKKEATKTNLEYLTQAIWKWQDAGFDSDKNGSIDATDPDIDDCEKDNTLDFNTDGSGTADEGGSKCDQDDEQTVPFTWVFKTNETQIEYKGNVFNILSLNDTQIKVYQDLDMGGGMMFRYVVIMKH